MESELNVLVGMFSGYIRLPPDTDLLRGRKRQSVVRESQASMSSSNAVASDSF
jgi:hypothetical protein